MQLSDASHTSARNERENGTVILDVRGVTKSYPGSLALNEVDFTLRAGEVHALCGENGAGKSTLAKLIAGSETADFGTILFRGQKVTFRKPLDAKRKGILLIHQELSLVPNLTVAENIYLGSVPTLSFGRVDRAKLMEDTERLLGGLNCGLRPSDVVGDLSIAKQQLVEIARAQSFACSIVIFDEPTASLSGQEAETLFESVRKLTESGAGVIYISHKLEEVFELSDRITVLRDGRVGGTFVTAETDKDAVTRTMIGRSLDKFFRDGFRGRGQEVLRVENFSVPGHVQSANFAVHSNEIVGLYGLVGSGRSELVEAIFGVRKLARGRIFWFGKPSPIENSRQAMRMGLGLVPEDRKRQGLVLSMPAVENLTLPLIDVLQLWGFVRRDRELRLFEQYRKRLAIKVSGPQQKTLTLSGGNQQKIVIAKWLATKAKLLIFDEPTRGIDVGAKAEIHRLISQLAELGMAVLVISSEMEEIIGVCHRVLTMHSGRITGEFAGTDLTEGNLIAAIIGHTWSEQTQHA